MNATLTAGVFLAANAPPMPDAPNFAALSGLSNAIEFIIGLLLAVAVVLAIIFGVIALSKWAAANNSDNPIKAKAAREAFFGSLVVALIAGFGFSLLFQAVWNLGAQLS